MEESGTDCSTYKHLGKYQTGVDWHYFWNCYSQRNWRICRESVVLSQKRCRQDCFSQCRLQRYSGNLCTNVWFDWYIIYQYVTSIYSRHLYLFDFCRIDFGCCAFIFCQKHPYQRIFFTSSFQLFRSNQNVYSQKKHSLSIFALSGSYPSILFTLYFFEVEIPYIILLSVVASVYLLASSLPNFQAVDFALKGSVAIYLFGLFGVDSWVVTLVAALIWLMNLVIPISIGSVFLLIFNPKKKSTNPA